jgi:hypothetical protein
LRAFNNLRLIESSQKPLILNRDEPQPRCFPRLKLDQNVNTAALMEIFTQYRPEKFEPFDYSIDRKAGRAGRDRTEVLGEALVRSSD